jgi:hypothetical protein
MTKKTPEERKAYNKAMCKARYEANKEQRKATQKAYYAANKAKAKAAQRAWYEANQDKIKADGRAYREANKDIIKAKKYFQAYPGATEADYQRYQATCRCECCGVKLEGKGSKQMKCQDHDHATGELRGVICLACNTCEGMIRDVAHAEALVDYLKRHRKAQGGE